MKTKRKVILAILLMLSALISNAQSFSVYSYQRSQAEAKNNWAWSSWAQDFRYQFKFNLDKDIIFVYCNNTLFRHYNVIDHIQIKLDNHPAIRFSCKDSQSGQIITIDLVTYFESVNIGNGLSTQGERYEVYLRENASTVCFRCS